MIHRFESHPTHFTLYFTKLNLKLKENAFVCSLFLFKSPDSKLSLMIFLIALLYDAPAGVQRKFPEQSIGCNLKESWTQNMNVKMKIIVPKIDFISVMALNGLACVMNTYTITDTLTNQHTHTPIQISDCSKERDLMGNQGHDLNRGELRKCLLVQQESCWPVLIPIAHHALLTHSGNTVLFLLHQYWKTEQLYGPLGRS